MPWCSPCGRSFKKWPDYYQHMNSSPRHNYCQNCDEDFEDYEDLEDHWVESSEHYYCRGCQEHFADEDDLEEHYEDVHWYCRSCSRFFKSEHGLKEHYRQSPNHHYCANCDRHFQNENSLKYHLNSSIHQPKPYGCPAMGCGQKFISQSAVILHLESGGCPSGLDRAAINREVRRLDRNNVITDPTRLLTWSDEPSWTATPHSWNGLHYECYLCHNTFRTLSALNQHLASPRHQSKVYICPLSNCQARFTTLSGLWQHVESEKCGILRFANVKNTMDGIMRGMKRLAC